MWVSHKIPEPLIKKKKKSGSHVPNRFSVLWKKNARDRGGSSFLQRVKRAFPDEPKGRTLRKIWKTVESL